ncbi:MAG: glycoside hydrolase family 16 protein [Deltaproteobacteria bacterium]|nr:glycoside hydrolase family 16 protein [Deltaproteobacteria bacterium]
MLVWSDEFNSDYLDTNTWSVGIGDESLGREAYATDRSVNLHVVDGHLEIVALHEDYQGKHYTTSGILTKDAGSWQYGRIEASMKVPVGKGCWPAFWMMPQYNIYGSGPPFGWSWPRNGEIDIMESISQEPSHVYGTMHFVEEEKHASLGGMYEHGGPIDDGYHVYSIVWTEDEITWFFDDQEFYRADAGSERDGILPFHQEFYILVNLALGSPWAETPEPSVYPQVLLVDWIRVWQ